MGTKSHYPFLTNEIKSKLIKTFKENMRTKQIFIDNIKILKEMIAAAGNRWLLQIYIEEKYCKT